MLCHWAVSIFNVLLRFFLRTNHHATCLPWQFDSILFIFLKNNFKKAISLETEVIITSQIANLFGFKFCPPGLLSIKK